MERQPPRASSDEIDLYIRTYYSLLRSSGEVWVRGFEEAHAYSRSSLHPAALAAEPDVAAFAYAAGRLPACMPRVRRLVLGQSHEQFERAGLEARAWEAVRTRGRRRPLRWDGQSTLAVFVTSVSDIDDLVPIVTAWQIEWNKLHRSLSQTELGRRIAHAPDDQPLPADDLSLAAALGLDAAGLAVLREALGESWTMGVRQLARAPMDLSMRLLNSAFSQYQRAAQRWWSGIEPRYLRDERPRRRPVYFVSSNMHAMPNLLGGWARANQDRIFAWARERNPEGLVDAIDEARAANDEPLLANIAYYLLRGYLSAHPEEGPDPWDAEGGIRTVTTPGNIDVDAQIVELAKLVPDRLDPRVRVPGVEALAASDAVILNIDYPLGMAAYHHLSRIAQGVGEIRGIYVMGKAATLNGRVGDVMVSTVVHDEHSKNTYLFRNAFTAGDVQPWLTQSTVMDNQKAVTVRSAFLQNREYMGVFYREGFSVLEMEAGPYLSAIHELVNPQRHPNDELVHLSNLCPFDVGVLHYASDTPYSRRQSLLSKSLSYFGVESTYGCAITIVRRILRDEVARLR